MCGSEGTCNQKDGLARKWDPGALEQETGEDDPVPVVREDGGKVIEREEVHSRLDASFHGCPDSGDLLTVYVKLARWRMCRDELECTLELRVGAGRRSSGPLRLGQIHFRYSARVRGCGRRPR